MSGFLLFLRLLDGNVNHVVRQVDDVILWVGRIHQLAELRSVDLVPDVAVHEKVHVVPESERSLVGFFFLLEQGFELQVSYDSLAGTQYRVCVYRCVLYVFVKLFGLSLSKSFDWDVFRVVDKLCDSLNYCFAVHLDSLVWICADVIDWLRNFLLDDAKELILCAQALLFGNETVLFPVPVTGEHVPCLVSLHLPLVEVFNVPLLKNDVCELLLALLLLGTKLCVAFFRFAEDFDDLLLVRPDGRQVQILRAVELPRV